MTNKTKKCSCATCDLCLTGLFFKDPMSSCGHSWSWVELPLILLSHYNFEHVHIHRRWTRFYI